jgi:hypothetical protein
MSKSREFRLHVTCDNDAFDPDPYAELARILRETAARLETDRDACRWFQTIRDCNGNDVGRFALKPADYFKTNQGAI